MRYIGAMKNLSRAFTEHPASVGETWGEHALSAWGFAWRLQVAALAALVHAVLPFLCVKTGSNMINSLHSKMVTHRVRPAEAPTRTA